MSTMYAFDTLAFVKKLKSAGYPEAQAEVLAEAQRDVFREMVQNTLATKSDIQELKADFSGLKSDFSGLKSDFAGFQKEIDTRLQIMSQQLTIRLGGMLVIAVGVLAAMKFFGG